MPSEEAWEGLARAPVLVYMYFKREDKNHEELILFEIFRFSQHRTRTLSLDIDIDGESIPSFDIRTGNINHSFNIPTTPNRPFATLGTGGVAGHMTCTCSREIGVQYTLYGHRFHIESWLVIRSRLFWTYCRTHSSTHPTPHSHPATHPPTHPTTHPPTHTHTYTYFANYHLTPPIHISLTIITLQIPQENLSRAGMYSTREENMTVVRAYCPSVHIQTLPSPGMRPDQ